MIGITIDCEARTLRVGAFLYSLDLLAGGLVTPFGAWAQLVAGEPDADGIRPVTIETRLARCFADDAIALLERRRDNCDAVIGANKPEAERATIIGQELEVLIGEFSAGRHIGEAAVRAAIGEGES